MIEGTVVWTIIHKREFGQEYSFGLSMWTHCVLPCGTAVDHTLDYYCPSRVESTIYDAFIWH